MIRDFIPVRWRTRSPRRLVGGRANKRIMLIGTMRSDRLAADRAARYARCIAAGTRSTGYARILLALAPMYRDAALGSKPNHAARAVSLDACFPGTTGVFVDAAMGGRAKVRQIAAVAGSYGRSAATMTMLARTERYDRQNGRGPGRVTPAQLRRLKHKARRAGELA